MSHGDTALGEAWARALVADHEGVTTPAALLRSLSLDDDGMLRALCDGHERQCWSEEGEGFVAPDALVGEVRRDLERLAARGIAVERAALVVVCTRRLNDELARGRSRFDVDLHAMERLALAIRAHEDGDLHVTCGKVGGYDRYGPAFGPLAGRLHAVVVEGRARSEYAIPGLGRLSFVRDADDRHLLVSMASLVGKWARDLLMARVVRYHREHDAGLPDASGYHDPVTARFVEASRLARRARSLPDHCFERRALEPGPSQARRAGQAAKADEADEAGRAARAKPASRVKSTTRTMRTTRP